MENIDWANIGFGYRKTDYNVRCYYRDGKWGEIETCSEETIPMHMAATCLHYGQEAFEGLKAYRCPDGKVRVFRSDENAARLQSTCRGILMPELPTETFNKMIDMVVRLNEKYIPPYETGATLYLRPLLIGTSAQVGVHPASEYLFLIFATPVGPYFKGGFACNPYVIIREFDRSAPLGTGIYKVGGNYAASLRANKIRLVLGLDVGVEAFGNDHEGRQPAGFHVVTRQVQVVVIDHLSQLGGVQLLGEGARSGAAVQVYYADGKVVRKAVLHERGVEDHVHRQHAHRGQDIHRPAADDVQFATYDPDNGFHYSLEIMITLMPGRRPSTWPWGRARTSKVRVSNSPISRVAFQVA